MKALRYAAIMSMLCLCCGVAMPAVAATTDAAPKAKAAGTQVEIRNFAFAPNTMTVAVGTRVVWTNRDEEPHVVTSAGKQFASSPALDTSDTYAVTFTRPGTYAYYCSIHPMMVGTIIVQ
ncbi:cupredoxin family copper-binding protein [Dyella sp. EPa41]|uniref:cupredoxin domain-containing protein n=1 Tax=Dyella sp. EPa41 TaxID=1561194 RepID=UPI001F453DCB|nr:cupredoxin family copper-binding protein [Dyella sp. EPa41]